MKVLLLYDYPASPSGLATQGELLLKGLRELNIAAHAVNCDSELEKEWYYQWFKPDIVVGIGYWGHTPQLILHPQKFKMLAVPWLVADGYIANYQHVLNELPLLLVTSEWVKEMYIRDGIKPDNICVLPVGCDTDVFTAYRSDDPKILAIRQSFGVHKDQLLILTIGGDAASKGGREIMQALALLGDQVPDYKYVCKVWPQPRTELQNSSDFQLARDLGISGHVKYVTDITSRNIMPYLIGASDIYAAPSRLEGFGMLQVEAGACEKSVIGIKAMGMLDTLIHNETAILASVAQKIVVDRVIIGRECGLDAERTVIFDVPRTVDYRANTADLATALYSLMTDAALRRKLGLAGRKRIIENFDYRLVAKKFVDIVRARLSID